MKCFNTTGVCIPTKHYMVDLTERVQEIKKLVDDGKYFTINRARQYGKTTTLYALSRELETDYVVFSFSFEGISEKSFSTEEKFVKSFCWQIKKKPLLYSHLPDIIKETTEEFLRRDEQEAGLDELSLLFIEWIEHSDKPVVMIIDEVDSATNNQVFLDFLAQLRNSYMNREMGEAPAFQSVILAGVTDVKHLKSKIRDGEETKENSPWNIAADFKIDMSLSEKGIKGMLDEYETDHHTGMDTEAVAKQIRIYTNGYPFLVSRICELLDAGEWNNDVSEWTNDAVEMAVKAIVVEKNTLFDSIMGKVKDYHGLKRQLESILLRGETIEYLPDNREQEQLEMYGLIINRDNTVAVSNRIFEMRLYKYFLGESRFSEELRGVALDNKPAFTKGGELNLPLIMERFIETQKYIRKQNDEEAEKRFIEEEGREKFLTFLSPIINGTGTFSVESQTRDRKRMDVVIHYYGKLYIIELKIWHGVKYNEEGERQVSEYLDSFGLKTGYMLTFSFNKNKETGVHAVRFGDKMIYEGIV